ncbi:M14 family metallopeptidase [Nocardiopsis rhodophaea]|uniref:M14 family metallopeptidase n=2 Tax=Nocardiopsis rhodophaea TaxID=280238 RepID=UPI00337FE823
MQRRRLFIPAALIPLFLSTAMTAAAPASASDETPPQRYAVAGASTPQERTEIARTGVAIDEVGEQSLVITATPAEADRVDALGYDLVELPDAGASGAPGLQDFPPSDSDFHNFDELTEVVDTTVADHPDIAKKYVIGSSYRGRDIMAVKISGNVETDEDEPEVLFTHSQHAREHLTVEMAVYLLGLFTDEYGRDREITDYLNSREIWILPNLNPDGSEYDIVTGSYRHWRKNRQPNPRTSAVGTDMNRNWDYNWGCCGGSSGWPGSQTYRGASPESAPEVRAVADFVRGRIVNGEQQITVAIDWHTYSELILWPYGYTYDETGPGMTPDDYNTHAELGRLMARTNGYTPEQSSDLYITDGTINDWLWGEQRIFNYTFEMYPSSQSGGGFYPPDEVIPRETTRNREAVMHLLDYADCPQRVIGKEAEYCG